MSALSTVSAVSSVFCMCMCVLDTAADTLDRTDTLDRLDIQDTLDRLGIADTGDTLDRADMKDKMNTVNPAAHRISVAAPVPH